MIISPPYLPKLIAGESESDYVERAMQQPPYQALHVTALAGSYPVSGSMLWHNGLHIVSPHEDGRYLSVRAVADGTVIHIRPPAKRSDDPAHSLNYTCTGRSEWSDNGCVILEHTTDIGSNAGRPIQLTYYSLTMHLSAIDPAVKLNGKVYRKDVIGQPGSAAGCQPMIHFEICFDKPNLTVLLGRDPVWDEHEEPRTPTHNGRTDVLFGDMLIYLPVGTPYSVSEPRNAFWDRGHAFTLQQPIWVRMHYEKGQAELSCYDHTGKPIGAALPEKDAEYKLYQTAVDQHANAVRTSASTRSSPSGYYELRRFGRNLGPDPLPSDATHWRQIQPANTPVWVDLNAPGSFKHSDGDFLTICGYQVFDDDTDQGDQRCQSQRLFRRIQDPDPKNPKRHDPDHKAGRLGLPEVQKNMRRAICYFPTEWDQATIDKRFSWILDPKNTKWPVDKAGWDSLMDHAKAMSMLDLPLLYKNARWRMHPTEFIQTMKKCTWLSQEEAARCFGGKGTPHKQMMLRLEESMAFNPKYGGRPAGLHAALQEMLTKYCINSTVQRLSHFVGQISAETGFLTTVIEEGDEAYFSKYERPTPMSVTLGNTKTGDGSAFKGRGLIQITGRANNENYMKYKTAIGSVEKFAVSLALEARLACDVSGFYWVTKQRYNKLANGKYVPNGKLSINYWADLGVDNSSARQVTKCINSGLIHFESIRWPSFVHALQILGNGGG